MKKLTKRISLLLLITILGMVVFAGCSGTNQGGVEKKEVKLGYVNWAEGVAMTNLAKVILEDKMDYKVKMTMADPGAIFTSVSTGDYDAFLDAWLPVTHKQYMDKFKDKVVDLGYNYEGARIGLVVPSYMNINSIEELNSVKGKLNGEIIGIDSGAGIMSTTKKAIDEYGLDYELLSGSGPVMTASLKDAIDKKSPIVVTGWKPHWKFARYDLKFLKDPKKVYGEAENIHTIARKGIKKDMPKVAEFFKNFKLNDQQLGDLMGMIAESDKEPHEVAREWMKKNEDVVNGWLPKE